MNIATNLEQSKKLAEILPLESADMYYPNRTDIKYQGVLPIEHKHGNPLLSQEIPCWSLAALLDILPTLDERNPEFCKDIRYNQWHILYHGTATLDLIDTERYENLIDACVEMIIKLKELKLL